MLDFGCVMFVYKFIVLKFWRENSKSFRGRFQGEVSGGGFRGGLRRSKFLETLPPE